MLGWFFTVLQTVATPAVVAVMGFLTYKLLGGLSRYSIRLHARKSESQNDSYPYRFILQNLETVPIVDNIEFRIVIRQKDGRFLDEARLMAGPLDRDTIMEFNESNQELRIRCRELRPLDTWVVSCRTNSRADEVSIFATALNEDGKPRRLPQFSPDHFHAHQLTSPGPAKYRPDTKILYCSALLACLLYLFPILVSAWSFIPIDPDSVQDLRFRWAVDVPILLSMLVLSWMMFSANRRKPRPVVQGYLGWEFGRNSYRVPVSAATTRATAP